MRMAVCCVLLAGAALGGVPAHVVSRVLMAEDGGRVSYRDQMADGSWRDSGVDKPKPPEYPVRVELIATNSLASVWEFVYLAHYESGRVSTNREYTVKSARERLKTVPDLPHPPPDPEESAPAAGDALGLAKRRMREGAVAVAVETMGGEPVTNVVRRMGGKAVRLASVTMAGGKAVKTMTDGSVVTEPLRLAYTARVASSPVTGKAAPDPARGAGAGALAAAAAAGALAGAAATGAASKARKGA